MLRRNRRRYTSYSAYSKKPRIRWDRILIVGGAILFVLLIVIVFNLSRLKLMFKGYSFSEQNQILNLTSKNVDEVLSHDKMEHITDWLKGSKDVAYYDEFEQYYSLHTDVDVKTIISTTTDIFNNYVPKFLSLGYTDEQVWEILKTASKEDLDFLIQKQYTYAQIQPYMQVKGCVYKDMEKYIEVYEKEKNYNYAVLITTYPFINSANKVTKSYTIQNPENILTLVKPGFYLPNNYAPKDLVTPNIPIAPDCDNPKMRKEAATALEKMYKEAKAQGYYLVINSAYRSYDEQTATYKEFEDKWGGIYAAEHVAIPGASEHQTGLGVDLTSESVVKKERLVFGDTAEYKWVCENAYRFGYILRFKEGTASMTGIVHEPWHFRYVGVDAATKIHDNNWTLEEYCLNEGIIPTIKVRS